MAGVELADGEGSPPHAWGILETAAIQPAGLAGSPPHAWGIRSPGRSSAMGATVHPHTRGEYSNVAFRFVSSFGSPPHAWGILVERQVVCLPNSVHPHTRGEYTDRLLGVLVIVGSPPHAWGIRRSSPLGARALRFTPTRVGNTAAFGMNCAAGAVHPHTRGEYAAPSQAPTPVVGSPPHAWGIRRVVPLPSGH